LAAQQVAENASLCGRGPTSYVAVRDHHFCQPCHSRCVAGYGSVYLDAQDSIVSRIDCWHACLIFPFSLPNMYSCLRLDPLETYGECASLTYGILPFITPLACLFALAIGMTIGKSIVLSVMG
jgi:hypothetical protein